jgi:hypothetical protein
MISKLKANWSIRSIQAKIMVSALVPLMLIGCEASDTLLDATAVQLENALYSIMNVLLTTLVYNAFDLPIA